MLWALIDLIGGWKQVRASAGFAYQMSRTGKRRIVPIEGYRTRGLRDEQWVHSGVFADDGVSERFRDFSYQQSRKPKRARPAKMDFATP
jgi:hypothetical protein